MSPHKPKRWKRSGWIALATMTIAGCGATHSRPLIISTTVSLRVADFPQLHTQALVDGQGYALYMFAPDQRRAVTCTNTCPLTWPPLTIPTGQRPATGPGVEGNLIGTDALTDGERVVTYNGWPLYTYTADVQPGTASGQAIDLNGGLWYLLAPDGNPITAPGGLASTSPRTA